MDNSFCLTKLRIEGATCASRSFSLVESSFTLHDLTVLRWVMKAPTEETDPTAVVNIPLYLNTTRADLIVVVSFTPETGVDATTFYQRGVAMMCSSLTGLID